jgi:hypothetical protein
MRVTLRVLSCVCALLTLTCVSDAKEWRGIVPLHSTRADVERLLGKASDNCHCTYQTKEATVFVVYSEGDCKRGLSGGWDIRPDTVIRLTVTPKASPKLSELQIDLSKYEKREDPELVGNTIYVNEEEGMSFYVDVSGVVADFYYGPTAKDKYLRCPDSRA